jgi:hypothetical protein
MTEAEWLACTDSVRMLEFLRDEASKRKLRLFACALCRQVPSRLLQQEGLLTAIKVVEAFGDGQATRKELKTANQDAWRVAEPILRVSEEARQAGTKLPRAEAQRALLSQAVALASVYHITLYASQISYNIGCILSWIDGSPADAILCEMMRDIFGNPFRPPVFDPSWLMWNDGTVVKLAQGIYDDRAFDHLPILADALEEAGCTNADNLTHCRRPGLHVRGCWVVDMILGKE